MFGGTKERRRAHGLALVAGAMLVASLPLGAQAGPVGGEMCMEGGHGAFNELCAYGPAGCVAVGIYVKVEPNAVLPNGATVQLSRTQANAYGWMGYGYGHGDAHQAQATVPGNLGAGAIESACNAYSTTGYNSAWGDADVAQLSLDLNSYGVPVTLSADVLHEWGSSTNGAGGNAANILNLSGSVWFVALPAIGMAAAPNTWIPLGPAGDLYLNEQTIGFGFCPTFNGDALRLVVKDPTTGAAAATIIVSWVSTSTCP